MVQATTPTFILTLPETVDLSQADNVYFTIQQANVTITKTGEDLSVDGQTVSVYMTQDETLQFVPSTARLQLNWTYANGARACSNIVSIDVGQNLLKEVVV